jgi:small conductance mechanosensitive channel
MDTLNHWFNDNQVMLESYLLNIVIAIIIYIIGKFLSRVISNTAIKILKHRKIDDTVTSFAANIVYSAAFFATIIAAAAQLGFNTSSLIAILGAAGLAIGLALKDSLSNFASGVMLIIFKPFKAGDFVEVAGTAGVVEEVLIFATKLRTGDNKELTIPNGAITGRTITNYSAKPMRRIDLVIGVSYDADLAQTKTLLKDVVAKHELVLKDEEITIGVSELADCSVNFVVRPWVKTENYWPVYYDLLENIKVELDKAGIEIPFPQLSVHMNKENSDES